MDWLGLPPKQVPARKWEKLTAYSFYTSPDPWPVPSAAWQVIKGTSPVGKFVAMDTDVMITIAFPGMRVDGFPMSIGGVLFYWGDDAVIPAGQMTRTSQLGSLGTGVTEVTDIGGAQANTDNYTARVLLTGLTIGNTYRYEVAIGVLGGYSILWSEPTDNHYSIAVSGGWAGKVTAQPDYGFCVATRTAENVPHVCVFMSRHAYNGVDDQYIQRVALTSAESTLGRIALTPDGTTAVVTNYWSGILGGKQVAVIDTGVPSAPPEAGHPVVPPSIRAQYNLAATDQPFGVAITADATTAMIAVAVGTNAGKVAKMTIAGGATTYSAVLGAASTCTPQDLCISNDGVYCYVALVSEGKVVKVRISDLAIIGTASGMTNVRSVAISSDGTKVYATGGNAGAAKIWHIDTTVAGGVMTVTATVSMSVNAVPQKIAMFNDDKACMIVSSDTVNASKIWHYIPAYQGMYTQWPAQGTAAGNPLSDVALSPYGDIWVPNQNYDAIEGWPGCKVGLKDPTVFGITGGQIMIEGGV